MFVVVPDLLDHLRATFSPTSTVSYDRRFEEIRTTPLLVLDDLGTQAMTPWAREKLYQLFNHRYNAGAAHGDHHRRLAGRDRSAASLPHARRPAVHDLRHHGPSYRGRTAPQVRQR